jgi:3-hydroxyisobutyrate dehydrogenase
MSRIAVLGMGRMGAAMAQMLASSGHDVSVWNRTSSVAHEVSERVGCRAAQVPGDAVVDADIVLSVLADGPATQATLLDPGLLAALAPDSVTCDMSTSGVPSAHLLAREFAQRGLAYVDSPVAGSVASVLNRALLVMASGDEDAVERARPAFDAFARAVVHLGPAGNGQAMKLCAGLVVHTLNSAVAEGIALATRSGIDPSVAYTVLQDSSVGAPYLGYKREHFLGTQAPVAMSLDLAGKDLALIAAQAAELDLELPALSGVITEVTRARESGFGSSDMADVVRAVLGEPVPDRTTG